ncbi:MAG: hypothetical protein M3173_05925, partial [Chloroflexota bacterium]|nr:hypothetical protein [Chloroflexota bacterium]
VLCREGQPVLGSLLVARADVRLILVNNVEHPAICVGALSGQLQIFGNRASCVAMNEPDGYGPSASKSGKNSRNRFAMMTSQFHGSRLMPFGLGVSPVWNAYRVTLPGN